MDVVELLERIEETLTPVLNDLGVELVEREWLHEAGRWVLRLYIDREGGAITLEDCSRVSRAIEGTLDVENIIPHRYCLEVSSPGINRPLRRPKDFDRFKGERIELKSREPVQGRHHFTGILKGLEKDQIIVEDERGQWFVPFHLLKKARIKSPTT